MTQAKRRESRRRLEEKTPAPRISGRPHEGRWAGFIIVALVLAVMLTIIGFFYYRDNIAPFRRTVITVDNVPIRMDYFLERARQAGADPMSMLQALTNELIIKLVAPQYGITVTPQDIDAELRRIASGSENVTDITESEFKEWYRQQLNETKLSNARYRENVSTSLLARRLQAYLAERVPKTAKQRHLYAILVGTDEEAQKVRARWQAGESFTRLAREVSLDEKTKATGGDLGWIPPGVATFDYIAFSLKIGDVSEPLPQGSSDPSQPPQAYYLLMVAEEADSRPIDEASLQILQSRALQNWLAEEKKSHQVSFNFNSEINAWMNWQLSKTKARGGGT